MILDEIVKKRKEQLQREKQRYSLDEMKLAAQGHLRDRTPLSLAHALKNNRLSCICEVKKASPSKGLIRADFHPGDIAAEYEAAGADAISCLTEEHYFQGSSKYLAQIRDKVKLPILRKDFIFDEYQIFEAAAIGADAVLLIAAILDDKAYGELFRLASELGLSVLNEVHNVSEMQRITKFYPEIIGVNNRDLTTFEVDLSTAGRLRPYADKEAVFVSESGIRNNDDMKRVRSAGADAVLIGETLMRSDDIAGELTKLREDV